MGGLIGPTVCCKLRNSRSMNSVNARSVLSAHGRYVALSAFGPVQERSYQRATLQKPLALPWTALSLLLGLI